MFGMAGFRDRHVFPRHSSTVGTGKGRGGVENQKVRTVRKVWYYRIGEERHENFPIDCVLAWYDYSIPPDSA